MVVIKALLFLRDDGEIVRTRTGRVVKQSKSRSIRVHPGMCREYHRVKFALHHGYLPLEVDHRDLDVRNNSISNLRAANSQEQKRNRRQPKRKHSLPRGVAHQSHSHRFQARVTVNYKSVHFGTFDTPEEASAVVEAYLKDLHGEFYRHDV